MSKLIVLINSEGSFAAIPMSLMEDPGLSWKSKALWGYLRSRPPGWEVNESDLISRSTDGRDGVRSGVRELEAHGWLHREQSRDDDGTLGPKVWTILSPQTEKPSTAEPSPDNPSTYLDTAKLDTSVSLQETAGQRVGNLMKAFARMFGTLDERTRRRWVAVCKRLCDAWTDEELGMIAEGMQQIYPWSDGELFDPFHMERHGAKALATAKGHRLTTTTESKDEEWISKQRGANAR